MKIVYLAYFLSMIIIRQTNIWLTKYNMFVSKGFGDSEAGEILKQFPELGEIFTVVRKVGEGKYQIYILVVNVSCSCQQSII